MKILKIYQNYQIMPQLQQHQLRVAAVADMICENFSPLPSPPPQGEGKELIDRENIIAACLLHDMGNIVKFDFEYTKQFMAELVNPGQLDRWQRIQTEYREKYGSDSHQVTLKILKEINQGPRVLELVDSIGFEEAEINEATKDFGKKICAYSDVRVEPQGLVTLEERFLGLRHRYQNHPEGAKRREDFENALRKIEKQIFAKCGIRPEDIAEAAVQPFVEKLKGFEISFVDK